ncbi:purine-nucleoside phosphorylase [Frateuria aurantia]|uniref:Purine nucleoside permease n=1 Tax=Frateuria aurantia (strain ATCC 33424 / DSM 6220 / KCTC 2777 / LMG 1558 / NBRC 3245 / NCIMB 13370) TaxID=767434 RepID=H8L3G8_FRAAD|nr:purine nucleoside permease [Frateuria aurantia]AFC86490.1 purine nucleoside permease [Frateuria aurantia DSM 6220]
MKPVLKLAAAVALAAGQAWVASRAGTLPTASVQKPWPIKVVIVTTFELGADTGDRPGEFQPWVEHEHLDQVLPFPGGVHSLRSNASHDVLGVVSGMTLVNAGASLMALGLDPRFDLSHAYWIINGIAGVDPEDASIGSVAWARYAINDVSRMIDPREAPATWSTGFFAEGTAGPGKLPAQPPVPDCYPLNASLSRWAFGISRERAKLPDTEGMAVIRQAWKGYPNAQRPPFVLQGDSFASDYFWHGQLMNRFANDWVKLWTGGHGQFVMTEMEDSGMMEALNRLQAMHRVDLGRVMIARAASNYSMPPPGVTPLASITMEHSDPATFEAAWAAASPVLHELLQHWGRYRAAPPGGPVHAENTAYCRYAAGPESRFTQSID